jgi:hypothetical protein
MKHLIIISSNADGLRLYNKKVYLTVVAGAANPGNKVNRTPVPEDQPLWLQTAGK